MSDQNEQPDQNKDEKPRKFSGGGQWIAIGVAVGVAIGVATDQLGLWIALGVAIGAALTAASKKKD